MKRIVSILLLLCSLFSLLTLFGCNGDNDKKEGEKLSVVATVFPLYDWAKNLIGEEREHIELTLLLDDGVDLHSYQPTVKDMVTLTSCDLLIAIGGESDRWIDELPKRADGTEIRVLRLLDALGDAVKEEDLLGEEEEEHDHDHDHEEGEADEHIFLSLRLAAVACREMEKELSALDPSREETYDANLATYTAALDALDKQYTEVTAAGTKRAVLVADRFPFRYLADDYGLSYDAAFLGCSAETEASFETVARLSRRVDEWGLSYVLILDGSDGKIARTVIQNTAGKNQGILTLNSLQSITRAEAERGVTYLSVMRENLAVLQTALQ